MIAAQSLQSAQIRLARHYLGRLRAVNDNFQRGNHEAAHSLTQFDAEWSQIRQWQSWSADRTINQAERQRLCADYVQSHFPVLRVRLPTAELIKWLQQGLQAVEALGDEAAERELLGLLLVAHSEVEAQEPILELGNQLLEKSRAARDWLNQGRALNALAGIHIARGQYDLAEKELQASLKYLRKAGDGIDFARALNHSAALALFRGDYARSRDLRLECIAILEKLGNLLAVGSSFYGISGVYLFLGDKEAALSSAQRSVEICRSLGNPTVLRVSYVVLAHAEKELGRYADACRHYEEGIAILRQGSSATHLMTGYFGWGEAEFLLGHHDQARALFEEALRLSREGNLPYRVAEVTADLALLQAVTGRFASAIDYLRECITQAQFLKSTRYDLIALGAASVVGHRLGQSEQAALWAGLVVGRPEYVERMGVFSQTCQQLEDALEGELYQALLAEGTVSSTEVALAEVIQQLEHPEGASA
jgi:tetratricopeptide (TPR) repeat protein